MSSEMLLNSPLTMAIVDIRFTDIPQFNKTDFEALFATLSPLGYKSRIDVPIQVINLTKTINNNQVSSESQQERIVRKAFINYDRTRSIHISKEQFVFKCTDYSVYDEFISEIEKILSVLVANITMFSSVVIHQVGLRYANLIVPKNNSENLSEYLASSWLGPGFSADANEDESVNRIIQASQFENNTKIKIDSCQFVSNPQRGFSIIPDNLADSPDAALNLKLQPWIDQSFQGNCRYVVLDVDGTRAVNLELSKEVIVESLNALRKYTKPAFENCITDFATTKWNEK